MQRSASTAKNVVLVTPEQLTVVAAMRQKYHNLPCGYKAWTEQFSLAPAGQLFRRLRTPIQDAGDIYDEVVLQRARERYANQCNEFGYVIGETLHLRGRGPPTFVPEFLQGDMLLCRGDIGAVVITIQSGTVLDTYNIHQVIKMVAQRHILTCYIGPVLVTIHDLPVPLIELIDTFLDQPDVPAVQAFCDQNGLVISILDVSYLKRGIECTGMFTERSTIDSDSDDDNEISSEDTMNEEDE